MLNGGSFVADTFKGIRVRAELVKFSHTVFAMPFALSVAVICSRRVPVTLSQLVLILLALVSARTAAMAWNRLLDRHIDARNPRTVARELPSGALSERDATILAAGGASVFLASSALLGFHCLVLAPLVLAVLFGYSWTKRFTQWSHLVLGAALGLAPGGVWYALTATFSLVPVPLMLAVVCWVAGFDIIYSCQDIAFDRQEGLFSLPARWGADRALAASRVLHAVAVVLLILFGEVGHLGGVYYTTVVLFAVFLIRQHQLVTPEDLSKADGAFFLHNGLASIAFFVGTVLDQLTR